MAMLRTSHTPITNARVDLLVAVAKHCAAIQNVHISYLTGTIYFCSCCDGEGRTNQGWRTFTFSDAEVFSAKQILLADPEADNCSVHCVFESMTLCPQCIDTYARPLLAHIRASDRNEP